MNSEAMRLMENGDYEDISNLCDSLRAKNERVSRKLEKMRARKKKEEEAARKASAYKIDRDFFDDMFDKSIRKVSESIRDQVLYENCFNQKMFEDEMNGGLRQLAGLYSRDVQINKRNTGNLDYEFVGKKLDDCLSKFMTNLLFGDSLNNVAKMQAQYAENALDKCLQKDGDGSGSEEENQNSSINASRSNYSKTEEGSRRSSSKRLSSTNSSIRKSRNAR